MWLLMNECTAFTCLPVGVTETLGLVDEYNEEEGVVSVDKNVGVAIINEMVFTTEVPSDEDSDEKMGVVSVAFIEGEAVSITEIPIDDMIINEDAANDVGGACDNEDKVGVSLRVEVVWIVGVASNEDVVNEEVKKEGVASKEDEPIVDDWYPINEDDTLKMGVAMDVSVPPTSPETVDDAIKLKDEDPWVCETESEERG